MRVGSLLLVLVCLGASPAAATAQPSRSGHEPSTPIEHFIFLMQENHSFDNYFGTYPGADGLPKDTCVPISPGDRAPRRKLAPGWPGAAAGQRADPSIYSRTASGEPCVKPFRLGNRSLDFPHDEPTFGAQYADGKMNGFVKALTTQALGPDPGVMGYYDRRDLPYYWKLADRYVLFDRFFQSANGGSIPNHLFWVTGTVGNPNGYSVPPDGFNLPTIFDRLDAAGISWKFYVKDYDPRHTYKTNVESPQVHWVPLLSMDRYIENPRLFRRIVDLDEYFEDLRRGTLPAVSFMVPAGQSEHPPGSLRAGQRFVGSLVNALMGSGFWSKSAFMWSYDDWGGFYDHVRPPEVDRFGYGFRVPALLVSPYAKRGHIDSTTLDFTSSLKFIERNWKLKPLASRDARANSIEGAFDFTKPPRKPQIILNRARAEPAPEPNRLVIYAAYGTALSVSTVIFILLAISWLYRRSRRGGPPPPRGPGRFSRPPPRTPSRCPAR